MGTVGCEAAGPLPTKGNSSSPKLSCELGAPHGTAPDAAGPTPAAVGVAGSPTAGSEPTTGSPGASDGHPAPAAAGNPADGVGNPADGVGNPADGDGNPADGDGSPADGDGKPTDGDGKPADGDGKPAAMRGDGRPGLARAGKPESRTRLGTSAPPRAGRSRAATGAPILGRSTSPNADSGSTGRGCAGRTTGSGRSSSSSRLPGALARGDSATPMPTAVRADAPRAGVAAGTAAGRSRSPKSSSTGGGWRGSTGAGKSRSATSRALCPDCVTTAGRSDCSNADGGPAGTGACGGGRTGGGGKGGRTRTGGGGRRRGGGGGPPRDVPWGRLPCSRLSPGASSRAMGAAMPSMVALFACCAGPGRAPSAAPLGRIASVGGST
jgi:hypothetical protein